MSKSVRRLYEQFHPSSYQLFLTPNSKDLTFSGTVTVTGKKVGRPSQRITLHQKGLKITAATLQHHSKAGDTDIEIDRINIQSKYDEVRLHATDNLPAGDYTITLEFTGTITKPMHGLYPCYFKHDGVEKLLLATQFESHHAREVFPCIDEPEAKATFDLELTVPSHEVALSNMPQLSEAANNDKTKTIRFETTPIMSTYLLAFVIGEMHSVEATCQDGTIIRTWSTVAQPKNSLMYANTEGVAILEFFIDYFKTEFPLKKCDQVALPDFEAGAMENWGLITYREIALLTEPENRSQSSEQYVSMVVAHEMSHQWFGDLVTMKWWDDLWLNESFASLMEHVALDGLHPDWFQWEQYTASDVISCSNRDMYADVQAVQVAVNHPEEIHTLFDPAIVYAKGGRLLKMMREYIGDDAFREALKNYFAKHAYKNTVGGDLWEAMAAASKKDISSFMEPWIHRSGMPLLSVTHKAGTIDLAQERFVLDTDTDQTIWPIPLLADQTLDNEILATKTGSVTRSGKQPVVFNKNGSGHMVVHYTDQEAQRYLADSFAKQILAAESRINVLNDMLLLSRRGDAPITDALNIITASSTEPREAVWSIMARVIATGIHLTEGDKVTHKAIKTYRRTLAREWYEKLGWNDGENDSPNDISLRHLILSVMVNSEDEAAIEEALRRFKAAKNSAELPAEQRALIIGAAVKNGVADIDALMDEYQTTPNPEVQLSICLGITSVKDEKAGQYIIDKALGKDGFVRPQDIFRWFAYLMRNYETREAAWKWLVDNWDRLEKMFGDSKSFEYFVVYSAAVVNTKDAQQRFLDFFNPKADIIALKRNIAIARSEIQARVEWRQREESRLTDFFADYR